MKIAVTFLLVAFGCYVGNSKSFIQQTCLTKLLQNDAPQFIQQLGSLICKYQLAKKTQNQQLFLSFLEEVNNILEDVGCTVDNLLEIKPVPTLENAEDIADKVAIILFQFMNNVLAAVANVLNDLPSLVSDIVDVLLPEVATVLKILEHIDDVKNVACNVLEDILPDVAKLLSLDGEILNRVLNDLEFAERMQLARPAI